MSTRARFQNANDSKSLWNYTLSPGWSQFDAHVLRLAIIKYGCGCWKGIKSHFPLKNCGQLNLQTQRLFGQQALSEFNKLHVDPNRIKAINDKIEGFRKNTCLINTGKNMTAERRAQLKAQHLKNFGVPQEIYEQIVVPVIMDPPRECSKLVDRISKLREMYRCAYDIQRKLEMDSKRFEAFEQAEKRRFELKKVVQKNTSKINEKDIQMSEPKEEPAVSKKDNNIPKTEKEQEKPNEKPAVSKKKETQKRKKPKARKSAMEIDESEYDNMDVIVVDANNEIIPNKKTEKKKPKASAKKKKTTARSGKKKKSKGSARKNTKKRKKMDDGEYVPPSSSSKRRRKK